MSLSELYESIQGSNVYKGEKERKMEGYRGCSSLLSVSLFIHVCGHQSLAKLGF